MPATSISLLQLERKINQFLAFAPGAEAFNQMANNPVVAEFDFPLMGTAARYVVKDITSDGRIILYNPTATRPTGH